MGPHHEKKIKRLIYPTLTFSALTTRLFGQEFPWVSQLGIHYISITQLPPT